MEMAPSLVMSALVMLLELHLVMMALLVMDPVTAKPVTVVLTAQHLGLVEDPPPQYALVVPILFVTLLMDLVNVLKAIMVLPVPLVIALMLLLAQQSSPIDVMI